MKKEIWTDIEGYEGEYQVSNFGQVRSLTRQKAFFGEKRSIRKLKGKILKFRKSKYGYLRVSLSEGRDAIVHRLVLNAFVGPCPEGMEACHNKPDKNDNSVENLRWDIHRNNMLDLFEYRDPREWLKGFQKGNIPWSKGIPWSESLRKKIMEGRGLKYDPILS